MKLISEGDRVVILNWFEPGFSMPEDQEYHLPPTEYSEDIGKEFTVKSIRDGDNGEWYEMVETSRTYHECEIELAYNEECKIVSISSVDELF